MDVLNVGEFAFTMCVFGVLLSVIAFAAAFFLSFSHPLRLPETASWYNSQLSVGPGR
jgi:hypothetical protein